MPETEILPALVTKAMFEKLCNQLPKEPGFARRFLLILQIGGNKPVSATELRPSQLLHKYDECAKLIAEIKEPALQLVRQGEEHKVVFFLAVREPVD